MNWLLSFMFGVLSGLCGVLACVYLVAGFLWLAILLAVTAVAVFCTFIYTVILNIKGFWY